MRPGQTAAPDIRGAAIGEAPVQGKACPLRPGNVLV